ncbi:hypothetical protein, partial [Pseudoalteromonas ruthenica]|uniref:hypothetical protein n=1 Tax=Pseudoalteromonas ruthenica TaxID=151081 RepID=UPI001285993E
MSEIDPEELSIIELEGMVSLNVGQVLGARDIQVIKLKFADLGIKDDKTPYFHLPRAKQRGHRNNNQRKKRVIPKALFELI